MKTVLKNTYLTLVILVLSSCSQSQVDMQEYTEVIEFIDQIVTNPEDIKIFCYRSKFKPVEHMQREFENEQVINGWIEHFENYNGNYEIKSVSTGFLHYGKVDSKLRGDTLILNVIITNPDISETTEFYFDQIEDNWRLSQISCCM